MNEKRYSIISPDGSVFPAMSVEELRQAVLQGQVGRSTMLRDHVTNGSIMADTIPGLFAAGAVPPTLSSSYSTVQSGSPAMDKVVGTLLVIFAILSGFLCLWTYILPVAEANRAPMRFHSFAELLLALVQAGLMLAAGTGMARSRLSGFVLALASYFGGRALPYFGYNMSESWQDIFVGVQGSVVILAFAYALLRIFGCLGPKPQV